MAGSSRRYAREAWLAARGTVGGGLSGVELIVLQIADKKGCFEEKRGTLARLFLLLKGLV